ncbi:MAG: DUF5343 domain-containing protein [Chloroflexi bacterium]|nr:DUF5343 domain-containing protein [Chloroflexota bacterium]
MADYPYTPVPGKMRAFFEKIQETGVPERATTRWLPTVGFTAANDRSILNVLKFIGFLSQSGEPTGRWRDHRDKGRAKRLLADAIRESYGELFQTYPDAYQRTDADLRNFFNTKTSAGGQVVTQTVTTFKSLIALADFSGALGGTDVETPQKQPPTSNETAKSLLPQININIQLNVPETTDEAVYDRFFAALKKHLLS